MLYNLYEYVSQNSGMRLLRELPSRFLSQGTVCSKASKWNGPNMSGNSRLFDFAGFLMLFRTCHTGNISASNSF